MPQQRLGIYILRLYEKQGKKHNFGARHNEKFGGKRARNLKDLQPERRRAQERQTSFLRGFQKDAIAVNTTCLQGSNRIGPGNAKNVLLTETLLEILPARYNGCKSHLLLIFQRQEYLQGKALWRNVK